MAVFWDSDLTIVDTGAGPGILGVWDQVALSSVVLPGIGQPIVSPRRKVDRRSPKQRHHGSIFDLGHELSEFTLKLHVWSEDQWAEWQRIKKSLDPTEITDEDKRFFSISHPSLIDCNVTQVYLNERSNWVSLENRGGGVKETIFKGFVIRKPADSGKEKAGVAPQVPSKSPGNVFEDVEPPLAPSAQGIYPADPK